MPIYSIYNQATGEIRATISTDPGSASANVGPGEAFAEETELLPPDTWYYPGGVKTERPLLSSAASWNKTTIAADGVDAATLSNLPIGSRVLIYPSTLGPAGQSLEPVVIDETVDASLSVTSQVVMSYTVEIFSFPYKPYVQTIEAVTP